MGRSSSRTPKCCTRKFRWRAAGRSCPCAAGPYGICSGKPGSIQRRDGRGHGVVTLHRVRLFAGKPAPTGTVLHSRTALYLWERVYPRRRR
ncbi:hypothetical protein EJA05_22655 [Pseudomonas oryziphila]|uniref:Uncharacterized protein n=1 Tax=Pseudomonas entomophila TaxID=312306 RepID=A0A3Q8U2Z1_9PSED|nr:hypothetical protein EJA05_22655 [Pseudomonas oryziphila]